MADQGLINFVITSRAKGMTDAEITEILSKNSLTTIQIEETLLASKGLNDVSRASVTKEQNTFKNSVNSSLNFVGILFMLVIGYVQISCVNAILAYGTDGMAVIYVFGLVFASAFAMLRIVFFYSQKDNQLDSSESFFVRILAVTTFISVGVLFYSFV